MTRLSSPLSLAASNYPRQPPRCSHNIPSVSPRPSVQPPSRSRGYSRSVKPHTLSIEYIKVPSRFLSSPTINLATSPFLAPAHTASPQATYPPPAPLSLFLPSFLRSSDVNSRHRPTHTPVTTPSSGTVIKRRKDADGADVGSSKEDIQARNPRPAAPVFRFHSRHPR